MLRIGFPRVSSLRDDEGSYDPGKDQPKSGDTSVEPSPAKVRTTQVDSSLSAELEQSLVFRES